MVMETVFMTYENTSGETVSHEVPDNGIDYMDTKKHMEEQGYTEISVTLTQRCGHHFTSPECEEDILNNASCKHTYGHCEECL